MNLALTRKCFRCNTYKNNEMFPKQIPQTNVCIECEEEKQNGLKMGQMSLDAKVKRRCLKCDRPFEGTKYIRRCEPCKAMSDNFNYIY